ncbi:MAG: diguanylate cyclase domain-containing protein [Halarcobacter sp.]
MKDKLKEITDSTVSELLGNDIILPSTYFECFDKHSRTINVNIDSQEFEKDLHSFLLEEYKQIDDYMHDAMKTIDQVSEITLDAQEAIKNKNGSLLDTLYSQIKTLQSELENIKSDVYKDYLTKTNNKKWIYQKLLTEKSTFKNDCLLILIEVDDYDYIKDNYSKLISNNLLVFVSTYLKDKLKDEKIDFEIARYLKNKFLLIVNNDTLSNLTNIINNILSLLQNTTLKSNSGIIINPSFKYTIGEVSKNAVFHDVFNILLKDIKENTIKN